MKEKAVSTQASATETDAAKELVSVPTQQPPPLPPEHNALSNEPHYHFAPPISVAVNSNECTNDKPLLSNRGKSWRSKTKLQSASWLSSLALHGLAFVLLLLILAPADFGGRGTTIALTLTDPMPPTDVTLLEAGAEQLDPSDSSLFAGPSMSALPLQGIGAINDSPSANSGLSSSARGSFFGIDANGHEFVYVLDMSGSMEGRRFDRASAELMRSVEQLGPNQCFYVLLFGSKTIQMFDGNQYLPRPIPGTPENKERLAEWLRTAYQGGSTDPRDALRVAMRMNPSAVFMLSDGKFNGRENQKKDNLLGGNADAYSIVAAATKKPPIHAIAFENKQSRANMKRLAEMTNGVFRFVDTEDRKSLQESIRQTKAALHQGDSHTAELFLRETIAILKAADDEDARAAQTEVCQMLFEFADKELQSGKLQMAKLALAETARLEPIAEVTAGLQTKLADKLLAQLRDNSRPSEESELFTFFSKFVESWPDSALVKHISVPLANLHFSQAQQHYADGDSIEALRKLETILTKFAESAEALDCEAEHQRIGSELVAQAQQLRKEKGNAAAAKYLRSLITDCEDTEFKRDVELILEDQAREMLFAARDAGIARDVKARKTIQLQLNEGFGEHEVLNRVQRELVQQERKAKEILGHAIRLERASQYAAALGRYRQIVDNYGRTLPAKQAQVRVRFLSRFY